MALNEGYKNFVGSNGKKICGVIKDKAARRADFRGKLRKKGTPNSVVMGLEASYKNQSRYLRKGGNLRVPGDKSDRGILRN